MKGLGQPETLYNADSRNIATPIAHSVKIKRSLSSKQKQVSFRKTKGEKEDDTSICSATETSMTSSSLATFVQMSPEKQRSLRNLALNILSVQEPVSPLKSTSSRGKYRATGREDSLSDLNALLTQLADALDSEKSPSKLDSLSSSTSKLLDRSNSTSRLDTSIAGGSSTLSTEEGSLGDGSLTDEEQEVKRESTFTAYAPCMPNSDDTDTIWVHSRSTPRPHLELNVSRLVPLKELDQPPKQQTKTFAARILSPRRLRRRRVSMV